MWIPAFIKIKIHIYYIKLSLKWWCLLLLTKTVLTNPTYVNTCINRPLDHSWCSCISSNLWQCSLQFSEGLPTLKKLSRFIRSWEHFKIIVSCMTCSTLAIRLIKLLSHWGIHKFWIVCWTKQFMGNPNIPCTPFNIQFLQQKEKNLSSDFEWFFRPRASAMLTSKS